jgi:hypothetical protein
MSRTLSATDRHHLLEAIDHLITARKQILQLLTAQVNGGDVHEALDDAIRKVKRAASKLSRYHPDAEILPLKHWSEIGELAILCDHERCKKPAMKEKEIRSWKSTVISAMSTHTAGIVSEIEQRRTALGAPAKPNPRDKYCYERMKKGDSLKKIMATVNNRRRWYPLDTIQGVSQAAKRHAQNHGLKWPVR